MDVRRSVRCLTTPGVERSGSGSDELARVRDDELDAVLGEGQLDGRQERAGALVHAPDVVEADLHLLGIEVRVLATHVTVEDEREVAVDLVLELAQALVGAVPRPLLVHGEHDGAVAAGHHQIDRVRVLDHRRRSYPPHRGDTPLSDLTQSGHVPRSVTSWAKTSKPRRSPARSMSASSSGSSNGARSPQRSQMAWWWCSPLGSAGSKHAAPSTSTRWTRPSPASTSSAR